MNREVEVMMARKAYDYALYLLGARGYTSRNLRRKLTQKEYEAAEIEAVMTRLIDAGLLDDARYAREYARQKLMSGAVSVRRVQSELSVKGISQELARAAIDEVMADEPVDIQKSIETAARKKLAAMGDLPVEVKRRRVFAFLARRGFEIADIKRTVERLQFGLNRESTGLTTRQHLSDLLEAEKRGQSDSGFR